MIKIEIEYGDITSKDILNEPNDEWHVITCKDVKLENFRELFGISLSQGVSRFNLVPVKFDRKTETLHLITLDDGDIEEGEFQLVEIYLDGYRDEENDEIKQQCLKTVEDLDALVSKSPTAPLHTIYMVALMDHYFGWNSTAAYDKLIHVLSRLKLPNSYRQKQFPLYRGLSISKTAYNKMKNGESFKLRKRVGTSWGSSKSRPIQVARGFNRGGNIILVELKPNANLHVILNGYVTKKDETIKKLLKKSRILNPGMLNEVILKGNGGLVNVTPDMVTNASGRKLSSFVKASPVDAVSVKNNIPYIYL